jgi:hypothetical protein
VRLSSLWLLSLAPLAVGSAAADTLFLRAGKTLKIESLACDSRACVARVLGGEIEVRAGDVLRVEPDEEVDRESAGDPASDSGATVDGGGERTIDEMVADAARKYALPRSLVRAVARAESDFDAAAISPRGAQGVMQLMPGTARDLGVQNALDPAENIDAGARLLRRLLEGYEGRVAEALAAYNAGPGAVARHQGVPPYRETRGYIRKVVKEFEKAERKRPLSAGKKR